MRLELINNVHRDRIPNLCARWTSKPVAGDMERSTTGNTLTQLGKEYINGSGFKIRSATVDVNQSNEDLDFDYFKNKDFDVIPSRPVNEYNNATEQ